MFQESGYIFKVGDSEKLVYGTICVVSADNPASNLLGGFKESAAANKLCRQCKTTADQAKSRVSKLIGSACRHSV